MKKYNSEKQPKSERITRLVENLYKKMPEIEADRGVLVTESYKETEGEPIITRRAKAFAHILDNIPITIRDEELIVGSATPPVQEVIRHGVNGLLAPFFNEARLARTVIAALDRQDEVAPLRAAARQTVVARYEREACVDRQLGFIGRLVAEDDLLAAQ